MYLYDTIMRRLFFTTLITFVTVLNIVAQARFVINRNSSIYTVLNNGTASSPIYLVLDNGLSSAITLTGTGGNGGIVSESEFNMIKWNIGINNGTYIVPFQYSTTSYIPLTLDISVAKAGTGAGVIKFSTWHGTLNNCNGNGVNVADNACYEPSDVTNMFPAGGISSPSVTDDSYYVVDRFWVLDANTGYTVKPDPQITFTYLNSSNAASEVLTPNKSIDGTLVAQRFNSTAGIDTWGDYLGQSGTTVAGAITSTVTTGTVDVTSPGFYRSWTLSSQNAPLPIQLLSFTAECQNYYALIKWTVASQANNAYFTIERTTDGINFETIAIVKGAGNTSTLHSYSVIDYSPLAGISYYRISQTDYDGTEAHLNTVVYEPCEGTENIQAYTLNSNTIDIQINTMLNDVFTISVKNVLGQTVSTQIKNVAVGLNECKLTLPVARGVYVIQVIGTKRTYIKKIYLGAL